MICDDLESSSEQVMPEPLYGSNDYKAFQLGHAIVLFYIICSMACIVNYLFTIFIIVLHEHSSGANGACVGVQLKFLVPLGSHQNQVCA